MMSGESKFLSKEVIAALITGIFTIIAAFIAAGYFIDNKLDKLPSWELLYSNNEDGEKKAGSKQKLKEAIKNGYDIKVVSSSDSNVAGFVTDVFKLNLVQIRGDVISGQPASSISWWVDPDNPKILKFPEASYLVYTIVDTTGRVQYDKYSMKGEKVAGVGKNMYRTSMEWLGLKPATDK